MRLVRVILGVLAVATGVVLLHDSSEGASVRGWRGRIRIRNPSFDSALVGVVNQDGFLIFAAEITGKGVITIDGLRQDEDYEALYDLDYDGNSDASDTFALHGYGKRTQSLTVPLLGTPPRGSPRDWRGKVRIRNLAESEQILAISNDGDGFLRFGAPIPVGGTIRISGLRQATGYDFGIDGDGDAIADDEKFVVLFSTDRRATRLVIEEGSIAFD